MKNSLVFGRPYSFANVSVHTGIVRGFVLTGTNEWYGKDKVSRAGSSLIQGRIREKSARANKGFEGE